MEKTNLISPITSLCFFKDLILSGQGPYLVVYDTQNGEKIFSEHALQYSRIHAIKGKIKEICLENQIEITYFVSDWNTISAAKDEEGEGLLFAIFGQRVMRVLEITNQAVVRIVSKTSLVSFPDLILDVHWLSKDCTSNLVAVATAHNAVWCFNWETDVKWQLAQCEENSILYSATFFGNDQDNLLLASGTVFNQVLLWKAKGARTKENSTKILSRLSGHDGVIFQINFNDSGTLMTSVSDDRSIRLWKLIHKAKDFTGQVEHLLVLYGHSARVWDAKILHDSIVSIGEDSMCNVWNYDGKLVKKFSGHKGRSIWSLAINKAENIIATGGGDGSIRLFSLDDVTTEETIFTMQGFLPGTAEQLTQSKRDGETVDSLRSVSLVKNEKALVMTSKGYLYEYAWGRKMENKTSKTLSKNVLNDQQEDFLEKQKPRGWKMLLHDSSYSSYSLMAVSPDQQFVAFGNLEGSIKVHDTSFSSQAAEVKPFTSKVLSLLWSAQPASHSLFSCGPEGKIIWWHVFKHSNQMLQMEQVRTFCIPYSKQHWASAVVILDHNRMSAQGEEKVGNCHVVFGDRKGSIHLFDAQASTKDEVLDPVYSIPVLHGHTGVTQLSTHDDKLYSAGRDGTYRQYRLLESSLEVIDTKKVYKGLEWVERLIFTPNGDLVIAGFHTAYFIVWSVGKNQPLFKVKCGGGHRAWDFSLNQLPGSQSFEAVFTYLKGNCLNVHLEQIKNSIAKPVLKTGFHGRETTCLCYVSDISPDSQGSHQYQLFVTGSEDTTLNLMLYNPTLGCLAKVFSAQGHISSIRALSITKCTTTIYASRPGTSSTSCVHSAGTVSDNEMNTSSASYLLFSGGGRASLRCWRVDPSAVNDQGVASSSPLSYISEYSSRSSNQRRRRKRLGQLIHSEIRFMSLSSFPISVIMDEKQFQDESQFLYGVAAACSDGFVRIFIFDDKNSKFSLLAQSEYLQRCVLTVDHVVHRICSGCQSILVFAGDTAGKISVWDITNHLIEYVREEDDDVAMETDYSAAAETEELLCLRTTKTSLDLNRENLVESMPETEGSCGSSLEKKDDNTEVKKNKTKFSCINLVQNTLGQPLHVFRAHQSGVNDISIYKGCLSYTVCSGGDDSALFVAEFNLRSTDSRSCGVLHIIREEYVQSAHTSSVTGISVVDSSRLISSSTDQRLKLWNINSLKDSTINDKFVTLSQVEFIDVPDVQAMETWKTWRKDATSTTIGVCGVGLQMVLMN